MNYEYNENGLYYFEIVMNHKSFLSILILDFMNWLFLVNLSLFLFSLSLLIDISPIAVDFHDGDSFTFK